MKKGSIKAAPALEPIRLGVLIPGSTPIEVGGTVWRFGLAQTETGQQAIFATACDWRELFIQALVATIGRALGLPIPPCFILLCRPEDFPEREDEKPFMVFACRAGEHPTMAFFAERMAEAVDLLLNSKRETTNRLIVLDEWALNGHRDLTTVLIDPAVGLQLVDHHPSLPQAAAPLDQMRNWVHEVAHAEMNEIDALRLRREMQKAASQVFNLDLGILADQAGGFGDRSQELAWLDLLDLMTERRHHLEELFCQRLGIAEQRLALVAS